MVESKIGVEGWWRRWMRRSSNLKKGMLALESAFKLSDLTPTVSSGLLGDCDCLFGDFSGDFRINELTSNGRYFEPFVVWGESVGFRSEISS